MNMEHRQESKSAIERYRSRVESLDESIKVQEQQAQCLATSRVLLAVPGIGLLLFWMLEKRAPWGTWQCGVLLIFGFLVIATWHENILWAIDLLRTHRSAFRRLIARCERDWKNLQPLEPELECSAFQSDLARDIDLFGDRSLFRWMSMATTTKGAQTIARWMTQYASNDQIIERQAAVKELVSLVTWREQFLLLAYGYRAGASNPEKMVKWGQGENYFQSHRFVSIASIIGPILVVSGVFLVVVGVSIEHASLPLVGFITGLCGAALNLLITIGALGHIHDIFVSIGGANRELQSLAALISSIETLPASSTLLSQVKSQFQKDGISATTALGRLKRIMAFAGLQRDPLFFLPYLVLQITILWDIRVLARLEKWKAIFGDRCQTWIEAIGILEALNSASMIADEYPGWCYPIWIPQETASQKVEASRLRIHGLGHPLLNDSARVINDCNMDKRKPILLITGSNMAGKSTMLRAIGINSVLARMGAVVCAASWESPNCELASSIRVQDSLQDGVSFFMAELVRLRDVVGTARRLNQENQRTLLVLLDEILQGTNSRERQIAVETVLEQLVELNCIVMISTHDLELAQNESIQRQAQVVHFREFFESVDGKEVMRFDYKMRPGVTPTTNALKLLELVGLTAPSRTRSR